MRFFAALLLVSTLAPGAARAEWPTNGLRVASEGKVAAVVADGAGGAFVVSVMATPTPSYVRVQRVTGTGEVASGWPAGGVALVTYSGLGHLYVRGAASDGQGGVYVAWEHDYYPQGPGAHLRVARVTATGALASGWPAGGKDVVTWSIDWGYDYWEIWHGQLAAPDSAGGMFLVAQFDYPISSLGVTTIHTRVESKHVSPSGGVTTVGLADYIANAAPLLTVTPDASGGLLVSSVTPGHIDLKRLGTSGGLISSAALNDPNATSLDDAMAHVLPLPPGPDVVVATIYSPANAPDTATWRLRRLDRGLQPVAGWPAGGFATTVLPAAPDEQGGAFFSVPDGLGGWELQRVALGPGGPDVLWPGPDLPAPSAQGLLVADGEGGFFHAKPGSGQSLVAEHVMPNGAFAPMWTPGGVALSTSWSGTIAGARVAPGRTIVAWNDGGADAGALYAQLLADDAPVPAAASLVSAQAFADRVALAWRVPAAGPFAVERRVANDAAWARVGDAMAAGADAWVFEDRDITPGGSYAYRLVANDGALPGSEARVQVPALAFALRGFVTNPGADALEFTLPDAAPATLDVFDVTGRRLAHRDVGALGAGTHRVALPELRAARAGLVFARLARGGEVRMARATRLR